MCRPRLIILAAALITVAVITQVVILPSPRSVRYHLNRLSYLRQPLYKGAPSELDAKGRPVHFGDYFRFQTWRWYWRGGFSITKLIDEREQHRSTFDSTRRCQGIRAK